MLYQYIIYVGRFAYSQSQISGYAIQIMQIKCM